MERFLSLAALLLLLTGAGLLRSEARLSYFRVEKDSNNIVLTWKAEAEENVREYELLRRTFYSNEQFVRVKVMPAHGTSKEYRYVDDQVYKAASDQVDYQLVAVFSDGARKELSTRSINYTSTAVRRTWGSIKAMFQ